MTIEYQLVPKELTEEMMKAGLRPEQWSMTAMWRDMLAAAPSPQVAEESIASVICEAFGYNWELKGWQDENAAPRKAARAVLQYLSSFSSGAK